MVLVFKLQYSIDFTVLNTSEKSWADGKKLLTKQEKPMAKWASCVRRTERGKCSCHRKEGGKELTNEWKGSREKGGKEGKMLTVYWWICSLVWYGDYFTMYTYTEISSWMF